MPRKGAPKALNAHLGMPMSVAIARIINSASFKYTRKIGQDQCATLLGVRSTERGAVGKSVHNVMAAIARQGHATIAVEERLKAPKFWTLVKKEKCRRTGYLGEKDDGYFCCCRKNLSVDWGCAFSSFSIGSYPS